MPSTSISFVSVFSLFLAAPFLYQTTVHCARASYQDAVALRRELLANYSKYERPVRNQSDAVVVTVTFMLLRIVDVNDLKEHVTFGCVLWTVWKDEFLQWSPDEYGGMSSIHIDRNFIWAPSLAEYGLFDNSHTAEWLTNDIVQSDGTVIFKAGGTFGTDCDLDMTFFPFDEQTCDVTFFVEDYLDTEVLLVNDSVSIPGEGFETDGQWDLVGTSYRTGTMGHPQLSFSILTVSLVMRRLYTFYVLNILMPFALISLLTLLTFLVPAGGGERASFALTALLAQVVFLNVLTDAMPRTSDDVPLVMLFCLAMLVLSAVAVLLSVLTLALHDAQQPSPTLLTLLAWILCLRTRRSPQKGATACFRSSSAQTHEGDDVGKARQSTGRVLLLESRLGDGSTRSAASIDESNNLRARLATVDDLQGHGDVVSGRGHDTMSLHARLANVDDLRGHAGVISSSSHGTICVSCNAAARHEDFLAGRLDEQSKEEIGKRLDVICFRVFCFLFLAFGVAFSVLVGVIRK
ncbi:hypothetical protein BaRGS_00015208 [Batillaria attramentaria]|uniref:Uncharacterized protein n=1 Tax=Batillaria attramentaria TaxID=370345 RepID=A0ABD0L369_9CAEN